MEAVLVRERRCEKSVLEGRRDIRGAALITARPVKNRRRQERAHRSGSLVVNRGSLSPLFLTEDVRWRCETRVFVFENRIVSC